MEKAQKSLGTAKRIRIRLPLAGTRSAWDCRPFGFGRIIAPVARGTIDIAPGVQLDLATGTLHAEESTHRRSA